MSYTVSQLITGAYYSSGIVSRDFETVSGSQSTDGLIWLNEILNKKTVQTGLVPYETTYIFNAVVDQESYFIPNLINVNVLTFYDDNVRFPVSYQLRDQYFGSARADSISTYPALYTFDRHPEGATISVYPKPDSAYPFHVRGLFRLADVTLTQDLLAHQTIANLGTSSIGGNGTFGQYELIVNDYDLYNIFLDDVRLATTAALTATYANGTLGVGATLTNSGAMAALTIDSVATVVGDRVLVKDQATASQNGIYTVTDIGSGATNWVLTRATDFDTAAEMIRGLTAEVTEGTVGANLAFSLQSTVSVVGTDTISFDNFDAQDLANYINTGVITGVTATISGTEFILKSIQNPQPLAIQVRSAGTMGSTNYITFTEFSTLNSDNLRVYFQSTIDRFYIAYLRRELTVKILIEYNRPVPANLLAELEKDRRDIRKRSRALDLRLQSVGLFGTDSTINYGYINFGSGWTV